MTTYCTLEEAWGTSDISSNDYPPQNVENYNVSRMQEDMKLVGAPVGDVEYSKLLGMNTQKLYKTNNVHRVKKKKRTKTKKHINNNLEVETASELSSVDRVPDRQVPRYMESPNGLNNHMSLNENVNGKGIDGLNDYENVHSLQYVPEPLHYNVPEQQLSTPINRVNNSVNSEIIEEELKETYDDINNNGSNNGGSNNKSINEVMKSLKEVLTRLDRMETTLTEIKYGKTSSKGNIHDIVLFVLMGIFLIFILDSIFRVGRMTPRIPYMKQTVEPITNLRKKKNGRSKRK